MDIHADTEHDSLRLLALTAKSALLHATGRAFDCAVTLARPGQDPLTAANCSRAAGLAKWDQSTGQGPVSQTKSGRLTVIASAQSAEHRWPAYREQLLAAGYRSAASAPLPFTSGSFAAITFLSTESRAWAPAVRQSMLTFTVMAGKSLMAATEVREALAAADRMRWAIQGRTSIDVACGVIMGKNRCSYEEALRILVQASCHHNVDASIAAETILKDLPGGPPATHFGA